MGIVERINSVLEYKLEINFNQGINLDKRVNRNKTLAVIVIILVLLNVTGFYIVQERFGVQNKSYYENKMSSLNQLLKENPGSRDVQTEIAMTTYLNGDTAKSVKQLREVLRKDPLNSNAQFILGVILSERKEIKESTELLTTYVKKHQGLEARIAYMSLGQNCLAAGNYDLALKYLSTAAERDSGNPIVYYYLGQTYERLKKTKEAIESYEKALELNGGYIEADKALTSLLNKSHKK